MGFAYGRLAGGRNASRALYDRDVPFWGKLSVVTAAPLLLAAIGVVHPHSLNAATAGTWVTLHVAVLPIFPLVATGFVVPLWGHPPAGVAGVATVIAWVAAFCYACFYTGLDAVAGIAAGTAMRHAPPSAGRDWLIDPLYRIGNQLGHVGAYAFMVAGVAAAVALLPRGGIRAAAGGAVLLGAGYSFIDSHIFWPHGVLTMLAFAVGFGLFAWAGVSGSVDRRWPLSRARPRS